MEQVTLKGHAVSVPGGFQGPNPEQPGLTPELALIWAKAWTRDLPKSFHILNDSVIVFLNRNITRAFSADVMSLQRFIMTWQSSHQNSFSA